MRILLLNYEYPPIGGGASTATFNLLKQLSGRDDIEIDLITSSVGDYREEQHSENIKIYFLDIGKKDDLHNQSNKDLLSYSKKALKLGKKLKKEKEYDLVHAFFGIPCGFIAKKLKLPYIVSLRGSDVPFYSEKYWLYDKLVFQRLSRKIWKKARFVVANSEGLKKLAQETNPKQEIGVIYNGVDTEMFAPAEIKPEEFTVISTSRFEPRKGLEYLVEGFAKFHKKHKTGKLILIGEGSQYWKMENQVRNQGIKEATEFVGALERKQMPPWYQKADVFVLPSLNEGMSNSLLEALASGLAIVATDTGGTKELVDESNGVVVKKKSGDEVAGALEELFENKGVLEKMKKTSRKKAEGMSWDKMVEGYIKIYKNADSKR